MIFRKKKGRKILLEKSQGDISKNKNEEGDNKKTLNFSSNKNGLSVEESAKLDAIGAKAKGISKEDQIAYAKTDLEMHRITSERYYAVEENKLDNELKRLQGDKDQSIFHSEESQQGRSTDNDEQEKIRMNNAIEQCEVEKSEATKNLEHIEFKYPFKPIWDKGKLTIKQMVIILLFALTAFVGYNLNQDFFTLIVGASSSGFILSVIVGLLDGYVGHAVGEQFAAKKIKKGMLYLLCGLALIIVVYLGQEAALRQQDIYNDIFNEVLIGENTTESIQAEDSLDTGALRAAFIAFLFILSAAISYDYYKVRDEILPHLVRDSLKKSLSKINKYMASLRGELASVFSREKTEYKLHDDRINNIVEKKEQLQILKNEELKKIDNLEARVIYIINQVYSNQH